jgi:hypothetical protein
MKVKAIQTWKDHGKDVFQFQEVPTKHKHLRSAHPAIVHVSHLETEFVIDREYEYDGHTQCVTEEAT